MKTNVQNLIDRAKVSLVLNQPFFGSILLRHNIRLTEGKESKCPTACVDKQGVLWIDKGFAATLSEPQIRFLLAHEVMHVVYAHLPRLLGRDPQVWNVACDAVVNALLKAERVGEFIPGGVDMPEAIDMTADEVYAKLMQKQKKQPQPQQGGAPGKSKEGLGSPNPGGIGQDLLSKEAEAISAGEAKEAEAQGKMEIAQAAQACRLAGKLSGGIMDRLREMLESKTPWHQILEQYMCGKAEMHHSWNRPNKRYAGRFYLPRRERIPSMGDVVIQIDTSGSITDKMINEFMAEVARIVELCHPEKVHLLYTDARVEWVRTFERGDEIEWPQNSYGGGTDMREGIEWAKIHAPEADLIVTFTDGYTPFPDDGDTEAPMIWVITDDGIKDDAPVGETIHM